MEATKKKMGRPVIGNPKTIEIRTRIDDETSKKVDEYCSKRGITRSDFLRIGISTVLSENKK